MNKNSKCNHHESIFIRVSFKERGEETLPSILEPFFPPTPPKIQIPPFPPAPSVQFYKWNPVHCMVLIVAELLHICNQCQATVNPCQHPSTTLRVTWGSKTMFKMVSTLTIPEPTVLLTVVFQHKGLEWNTISSVHHGANLERNHWSKIARNKNCHDNSLVYTEYFLKDFSLTRLLLLFTHSLRLPIIRRTKQTSGAF